MTPLNLKKQPKSSSETHLCWDCLKARLPGSCDIYESLTSIIEDNFDEVKIFFNISECNYFEEDKMDDKK